MTTLDAPRVAPSEEPREFRARRMRALAARRPSEIVDLDRGAWDAGERWAEIELRTHGADRLRRELGTLVRTQTPAGVDDLTRWAFTCGFLTRLAEILPPE